jgi:putative metallohydrolase (TIGR04338 family)
VETVVLHELAHHIIPASHDHDERWREAHLGLLDRYVAPEVAFALRIYWSLEGL